MKYRIDGIPEVNYNKHTNDVKKTRFSTVNIDMDQRDVAGDNSW